MNKSKIEKPKLEQMLNSEPQHIVNSSAQIAQNAVLAEVRELEYFLCSKEVIRHFPNLKKSKPFESGYSFDRDEEYFVVATDDYKSIEKYYKNVIEPFNEKSNVDDLDFWLREVCNSQLDDAERGCLSECKSNGIFVAIEHIWMLTNEKNRAYAIYKMSEFYNLNPIQFVNKARL
jgi:hypothetical protein